MNFLRMCYKSSRRANRRRSQSLIVCLPDCLSACRNALAACLFILSLSCQQSPFEKGIENSDDTPSPVTINMPPLGQEQGHLFEWSDTGSTVLLDKTADIFLFSEGLMELGALSYERYFTEMGP